MRIFTLLPLVVLAACAGPTSHTLPTVATTLVPTGWLLERLLGSDGRVVTLVGPGDNPHTWSPSDATARDLGDAQLYARVGSPLEAGPWFAAITSRPGLKLVDLEPPQPDTHDHDDPHPWTDPSVMRRHGQVLAAALVEVFPQAAERINGRAAALDTELAALDHELATLLEPCHGKAFLVFHPAWGAFAEHYGLEQLAVEHEGKDPLDAELVALRQRVEDEGIEFLLVQPQVKRSAAQAVAEAFGLETMEADPLSVDPPKTWRELAAALAGECAA